MQKKSEKKSLPVTQTGLTPDQAMDLLMLVYDNAELITASLGLIVSKSLEADNYDCVENYIVNVQYLQVLLYDLLEIKEGAKQAA